MEFKAKMTRLNSRTGMPAIAFIWGLAEASFFFVVPDVLISGAAAVNPKRSLWLVPWAVLGALLAGTAMFTWGSQDPPRSLKAVLTVPFVKEWMVERTQRNWEADGIQALYVAPTLGIPYKLNAVVAHEHTGLISFSLHTVPARGYRFFTVWLVCSIAGIGLRFLLKGWASPRMLLASVGSFWVVFYAIYWTQV